MLRKEGKCLCLAIVLEGPKESFVRVTPYICTQIEINNARVAVAVLRVSRFAFLG
jgi:hypothetical protein